MGIKIDNKIRTLIILFVVIAITIIFIIYAKPFDNKKIIADNTQNTEVIEKELTDVEVLGLSVDKNEIQLIDVRTAKEYAAGHADGAINIPVEQITAGNYLGISKTLPIYLYCRSGRRADTAKSILEQAGFTNITNLGGLEDWQTDGGKVCSTTNKDC